jgi:hypothetical protein
VPLSDREAIQMQADAEAASKAQEIYICATEGERALRETLKAMENPDWRELGYMSAAAEIEDMANVGRDLIERIGEVVGCEGPMKGWTPADCPTEIVFDMLNMLTDDPTTVRARALEEALRGIKEQAECRIDDGKDMGAQVWRIALEDIVRDANAALAGKEPS